MAERVDYVIVGAGVLGCAVAWELARAGRDVVVLEAGTVAGGASGGVGMRGIRTNGRDQRELPLMRRAHELWPELADAIGAPTGFARTGHLQLLDRRDDPVAAGAQVEDQGRHGIATELVQGERLRELEPDLAESLTAAMFCPDDGVADHTETTLGLARAAEGAGAVIREDAAVTGLVLEHGDAVGVVTAAEEEIGFGDGLLVLANVGTGALLATVGVEL